MINEANARQYNIIPLTGVIFTIKIQYNST